MRAKATKKSLLSKIEEFKQEQERPEDHHENPLLKLLKQSKKEKQQAKTNLFNERLLNKVTFNLSGGISKSARKRRNKKAKEELKPKMDDLFSSLPEATVKIVKSSDVKTKKYVADADKKPTNAPNPQKHTGHTKLLAAENEHFNRVLQNKQFRSSPFAALKEAIGQNMQK